MRWNSILSELEASARGVRNVRASLALHRAGELIRAMSSLTRNSSLEQGRAVCVVVGKTIQDRKEDEVEWVHSAWPNALEAQREAGRLNSLAAQAGVAIGNMALVALTHGDRETIREAIGAQDPNLRVGRHGVHWRSIEVSVNRRRD